MTNIDAQKFNIKINTLLVCGLILSLISQQALAYGLIFNTSFEVVQKPGPDNTGPSDESVLVPTGSFTADEDGAIIEDVFVTGRIKITADNVTIRNFKIDATGTSYGIQANLGTTGLWLEDGEIMNMNSAGILGTGYTALRLNIHDSGGDGLKVQGGTNPTYVGNSWIHHLGTNDGAHADGNQSRSGSHITFTHNNCDMPITDPAPYKSNACFMLQTAEGPLDNFTIKNNWLNGGNYTLYCAGTRLRIIGNKFGRDYRYGIRNSCSNEHTEWRDNVWDNTGAIIPN